MQSTNGDADTRNKLVDTAGEGQGKMNWESSTETNFSEVKVKLLSRVQLCDPMDCSPPRLLCPWDFPGKNAAVGCHFLLQEIFPTQGLNPGLLHYRQMLYHLSHQGSPSQVKRKLSGWEKIIPDETTDKGLISKIYKQLIQLNIRKTNNQIKKWEKKT